LLTLLDTLLQYKLNTLFYSLRSVDLSENGLLGLPVPSLWKSQLMKEILVAKNKLTKVMFLLY